MGTVLCWSRIRVKDQSVWVACATSYNPVVVATLKDVPWSQRQYLPESKIWLVSTAYWAPLSVELMRAANVTLQRDPAVGRDAVAEIEEQEAGSTAQARKRAARRGRKTAEDYGFTYDDPMSGNTYSSRRAGKSKLEDDVRRASDVGANSRTAKQQAEYAQRLRDQIFGKMEDKYPDSFRHDDAADAFRYGFGSTPAGAAQQEPPRRRQDSGPPNARWWAADWPADPHRTRTNGRPFYGANPFATGGTDFHDDIRRAAGAFARMGRKPDPPRSPPPPTRPGKGPTDADYRALGVAPGAPAEAVRAAHRKAALANHPDRGGDAEKAAEINTARDRILASLGAAKH